jgi:hypothetical protein
MALLCRILRIETRHGTIRNARSTSNPVALVAGTTIQAIAEDAIATPVANAAPKAPNFGTSKNDAQMLEHNTTNENAIM